MAGGRRRNRRGERAAQVEQLLLDRHCWGGFRPGAGRKKSKTAGVSHDARERTVERCPVHVTLKLAPGLPGLRAKREFAVLVDAIAKARERAGSLGAGFRVLHFSVLEEHVHLIVEAVSSTHLSRGMQGLCTHIARGLNRVWSRAGRVFADRFHGRALRSAREVRNAVRYVLLNGRRHGAYASTERPDPFSSGEWFDGWKGVSAEGCTSPRSRAPVSRPRSWLAAVGWRRLGLRVLDEVAPGVSSWRRRRRGAAEPHEPRYQASISGLTTPLA